MEISAGQFGGAPAVEGQRLNAAIVVVALILPPVLCAALLKPVPAGHHPADGGRVFPAPFHAGEVQRIDFDADGPEHFGTYAFHPICGYADNPNG